MKARAQRQAAPSFSALTAGKLMTAHVLTIPEDTSLREAGRLLHRANISGAPVVDAKGKCIGIISSSDFVNLAGEGVVPEEPTRGVSFLAPWGELISIDESPQNPIREYMTAQPVTTTPGTRIGEVAQQMVDHHIHRLLVVTDDGAPAGIITSTDVMAAVSRATRPNAK